VSRPVAAPRSSPRRTAGRR